MEGLKLSSYTSVLLLMAVLRIGELFYNEWLSLSCAHPHCLMLAGMYQISRIRLRLRGDHNFLSYSASPAAVPGFHECILNNNRYSIGQEFHPVVEVNGTQYEAVCFQCVCQPVSAVCKHPERLTNELRPRLLRCLNCLAPGVPPLQIFCAFRACGGA